MKIQIVSIRGYRSIRQLEMTALPNLTVLVGKNNAGKSNILRAVHLLSRFCDSLSKSQSISMEHDCFEFSSNNSMAVSLHLSISEDDKQLMNAIDIIHPQPKNAVEPNGLKVNITYSNNTPRLSVSPLLNNENIRPALILKNDLRSSGVLNILKRKSIGLLPDNRPTITTSFAKEIAILKARKGASLNSKCLRKPARRCLV